MIIGEFDPYNHNRPTVTGVVQISKLGIECVVDFLLDTGADATCLHYPDIAVSGLDQHVLKEVGALREFGGVGGDAKYRQVSADITFEDTDRRSRTYATELLVADMSQETMGERPSLLGRDILDLHLIVYDPQHKRLTLILRVPE
ncbi:MAG: hypothetical protein OXC95_14105 [Dehalococcoidia bacterium]|nr:hypothetical protein [Dehalococcoidia bacterium]